MRELCGFLFGLLHEQRSPTQYIQVAFVSSSPDGPRGFPAATPLRFHILAAPSAGCRGFACGLLCGTCWCKVLTWDPRQLGISMHPVLLLNLKRCLPCCSAVPLRPASCLADGGLQHAGTWS